MSSKKRFMCRCVHTNTVTLGTHIPLGGSNIKCTGLRYRLLRDSDALVCNCVYEQHCSPSVFYNIYIDPYVDILVVHRVTLLI